MKSLDFEIFPDKDDPSLFSVHLGSGKWFKFKNITKAETFVRKYKAVIRDNVGILNTLQPHINSLYRQNILHFDPKTQRAVSESLREFDFRFEYIFKSFSPGNKNTFIFSNIEVCLVCLQESSKVLYSFAKRYKHYGLKSSILPIIKNLDMIEKQITSDKHELLVKNGYFKNAKVIELTKVEDEPSVNFG